jgi:Glucose-6-phosphate dehydrogenase, C-terminal domain
MTPGWTAPGSSGHLCHGAVPQDVHVIDVVRPGGQARDQQGIFRPGYTPAGLAIVTCSPARSARPHRCARAMTGTRPARDTLAGQLPRRGNVLSFSLAGDGEIDLLLVAKKPGPALDLDVARAAIPLASLHGAAPLPPYVRLIHDVLLGDRSLFTRPDGLAAVWQVAEPLLTSPPPSAGTRPAHGARRRPASSSPPGTGSWASNHPAAAPAGPLSRSRPCALAPAGDGGCGAGQAARVVGGDSGRGWLVVHFAHWRRAMMGHGDCAGIGVPVRPIR